MAHFAELDENGVVTQVVVVHNNELLVDGVESEAKGIDFLESLYGHRRWKQTSYNASGNPAKRFNYAGIGFVYSEARNGFIPPLPFPSWTLGDDCLWHPPVPMPTEGGPYRWDEDAGAWVNVV